MLKSNEWATIETIKQKLEKVKEKYNKMMRAVFFDVSGILEAFDYRGVLIHKQEVRANEKVKLPLTQKNLFKFNGVFFGVCEGVGDLDYKDYPKNLNFNALLCETIENYLLNAKEPLNKQQKALLADFLAVYEKNIIKGVYYLKPKFFAEKEKQLIETTTRLLTSYQIFLNQARESATNQINTNKTQAITNINEAKKTAFNELLETLKPKFSGLFVGAYYIRNVIYIQGGWDKADGSKK